MRLRGAILAGMVMPGLAAAEGAPADRFDVEVFAGPSIVELLTTRPDLDYTLVLSAPGDVRTTRSYSAGESVLIDLEAAGAGTLRDGLYRYEIVPIAAVKRQPGEVSDNLRGLVEAPGEHLEPVNGSFTILNGQVVDPYATESRVAPRRTER